jgi:hypothetical protein
MRWSWTARFLVCVIPALAACGSREAPPDTGLPVPFVPAKDGPTRFGDIPWPSDLYLDGKGHVGQVPGLDRVAAKLDAIQEGLSALDGFGRSTGALFFLDAKVDSATLPHDVAAAAAPGASVFFADVDPASKAHGTRYPAIAKYLPSLGCISVIPVPGVVLPPGVRHAAVLTTAAHAESGQALSPAPELSRIAGLSEGARSTPAEKLYGAALADLAATGAVESAKVAGLAVFTTSSQVKEVPALRERLRQMPEPELILDPKVAAPYSVAIFGVGTTPDLDDWLGKPAVDEKGVEWPGGDNPGGIAHDAIGAVASGAFVAPSFRDTKTHRFEKDANGTILVADEKATIPVTLVLPKKPPPAAGYPVVINGHGLSNNRGSMLSVANELCRAGFAMIGIDDVLHGARADIPDVKNNYKGPYQGPDGIPDDLPLAVSFFAGFSDFVQVRDNFRQTVLDQTSLVRLIQSSKLDLSPLSEAAGGTPKKLDPARIYWSGGSLGGIMGTMTTAVEPAIRAAALQVPGAGFVQFITTNSATVYPLVGTLATSIFGIQGTEVLDEFHPVPLLLAAITEAGDPVAYAPHVMQDPVVPRDPPDILVTYAIDDEVLPNIATVALVRALGIDLATPDLVDPGGIPTRAAPVSQNRGQRTAAAVQYSPANHGLGYGRYEHRKFMPGVPVDGDPRFPLLPKPFQFEMPVREHEAQLVTFFSTANAGAAKIEVTAPPRADFYGDGALDDVDKDPLDPTVQ